MELDLTGIHKLAAEQGIDPETLDDALAEALRLAYLKTPHAAKHARVELDERSGNFTVWAADEIPVEPTEDNPYPAPKLGEEYDDTPRDFGRLAAAACAALTGTLGAAALTRTVVAPLAGTRTALTTLARTTATEAAALPLALAGTARTTATTVISSRTSHRMRTRNITRRRGVHTLLAGERVVARARALSVRARNRI